MPVDEISFFERVYKYSSLRSLCEQVIFPKPFQCFGHCLLFYFIIYVPGVAGKNKLVLITFSGKYFCHILIGEHPIMHVVAHYVWIK